MAGTEGTGPVVIGSPLEEKAATVFGAMLDREENPAPPKKAKAAAAPEPEPAEVIEPEPVEEVPAADPPPADEETAEASEEEPRYRVRVDGEEFEVSQSELLAGYSRTKDYTTKTMRAAAERKAAEEAKKATEAERLALVEERKTIARDAALFEQALKARQPKEPDWDTLQQTVTPDEFAAAHARWQIEKDRARTAEEYRRQADAKVQADRATEYQAYLRDQNTLLLERIPEWKDDAVRKADGAAMRAYAKSVGYSDQQIDAVDDAKTMVMVRDAMLRAKAQTARPVVQAEISRIKSATPGGAQTPRKPVSGFERDAAKLKRTGSLTDAAKLMEHLVDL